MQTTRLNRPWLLKISIFTFVLIGFGIYGFYDATVAYPNRGKRFSDYARYEFFRIVGQERNYLPVAEVNVEDPAAELRRLRAIKTPGPVEAAKLQWLESLTLVNQLSPQHTATGNPEQTFRELQERWTSSEGARNAPKPLSWYDIPVQWLFVAVGFGGGAWLAFLWILVARQKYTWQPETKTLGLPGGQTITPTDLEDVDKRKWDKFLVFLRFKPPHPFAGKELKLDLYRHAPLEAWVLEMEREAFPDRGREGEGGAPKEPAPSPSPEAAAV
jgi:hypothetical protein